MVSIQKKVISLIAFVIFGMIASSMFADGTATVHNLYTGFILVMSLIGLIVKKLIKLAFKVVIFGTIIYFVFQFLTNL